MARGARLSPPVPVPMPVLLLALLAVRGARACCVVYDSCLTGGWDVVVGRDLGIAPGGPDPRGVICLSGTFGNNGVLQRAPSQPTAAAKASPRLLLLLLAGVARSRPASTSFIANKPSTSSSCSSSSCLTDAGVAFPAQHPPHYSLCFP